MTRPTALFAALSLASLLRVCAGASSSSSTVPWPAIPTQDDYEQPTGDVLVSPTAVVKGLTSDTSQPLGSSPMVFTAVNQTYTLDYGRATAGKPFFQIEALDDYAQIEVRYTEFYVGLENPQGDGPYSFANGLSATYRVETFNITKTGEYRGYFIQGSQRWQSITLVHGTGLTISKAGFVATGSEQPLSSIRGYFASSNSSYTDIWALGPRTEQIACFPPGSQSSTWDVTPQGAYIRGQKPAATTRVVNVKNYTMTFDTMIDYGGVGWRVDTEIDAVQATGPLFVLTSEYPDGSFANIDRSLVPPNTLILGRGWSLINQTTLPAFVLEKFPIDFAVKEKEWHTITTVSHGDDTYRVLLNDKEIASFNISSYGLGASNPFIPGGDSRGFALGPWQDQAAYYRNVKLTSNGPDASVLYSNNLTSTDILSEYGVATNTEYVCSDAGKRDRYSWQGDRLVSARTIMASSGNMHYVWGPAEQALSRQTAAGHTPSNTLFSPLDMQSILVRTNNIDPLLVDYNFDFIQIIWEYWMRSGNATFVEKFYTQCVSFISYSTARALDLPTQLYGAPTGPLGIPLAGIKAQALGPAETVSMILGLERMADISDHMNDTRSALAYRTQARMSREAIDTRLWNETGAYYAGAPGFDGYDMFDIAQVLLAKIGTPERRAKSIENLKQLRLPGGYKNGMRFHNVVSLVSPYASAFLLEGLAHEGKTELVQEILDLTWAPMARRNLNYTGGMWEYLSPSGEYPGYDIFTAGSHLWGSYATAFLTDYVLGVRPTTPGFATFTFKPMPGFNSEWVHGRVPTPAGEILAAWGHDASGKMALELTAPQGLEGTVVMPFSGQYSVDGGEAQEGDVVVKGGMTVKVCQL